MRVFLRIIINIITRPGRLLSELKKLRVCASEDRSNPNAPFISDPQFWVKKCRDIILTTIHSEAYDRNSKVIKSFYQSPITCLRSFSGAVPENEVILLATVKNDKPRLEHFLNHYRKLGVKHFVFIDNDSDDGTVEKILEQDDTACFQTKVNFAPDVKEGWFNRLAAHYGANRWYIVVDSDELLVYPRADEILIGEYVKLAQNKGYSCVKTMMLDVYPDGPLMDTSCSDEEYLKRCEYFDRGDTGGEQNGYIFNATQNAIYGGMRSRLFSGKTEIKLTKPTLLNFQKVFLISAHIVHPKKAEQLSKHAAVVLHYKFLPSDRERYLDFEKTGIHYDSSRFYKDINKKMEIALIISAMSELSVKWDEGAWKYLPMISDITEE